jgi:hypothetical protein
MRAKFIRDIGIVIVSVLWVKFGGHAGFER